MSSVKLFKLVTQPINSSTVTKQKWSLNVLSPVSHHTSLQSSRRWLWPRPLLPQPGRAGSPALPLPAPRTLGPQYHHLSRASSQKALTHCALPCMQLFLRAVCVWGHKKWGRWGTESRALFSRQEMPVSGFHCDKGSSSWEMPSVCIEQDVSLVFSMFLHQVSFSSVAKQIRTW